MRVAALTCLKVPAGGVVLPPGAIPPAGDGEVAFHPAGVGAPRADLGEGAGGGRRGLAVVVPPPAGDGAVALHRAGVIAARTDFDEDVYRRDALAVVVIAGVAVAPAPQQLMLPSNPTAQV